MIHWVLSLNLFSIMCECMLIHFLHWTFQFFPEANEVQFARSSIFEGASFKLDYLTKPSFFEDFGFVEKVKMTDRVKPDDELFVAAYPYFNVNGSFSLHHAFSHHAMNFTFMQFSFQTQKCLWWKSCTKKQW